MGRRSADGGSRLPPPYSARVIEFEHKSNSKRFLALFGSGTLQPCRSSLRFAKNRQKRAVSFLCFVTFGLVLVCEGTSTAISSLFAPYLSSYPPILLSSRIEIKYISEQRTTTSPGLVLVPFLPFLPSLVLLVAQVLANFASFTSTSEN
jgi:hypothetical protein